MATAAMCQTSTLSDYISQFSAEDIVFSKFFTKQYMDSLDRKILVNFSNVVDKFNRELKATRQKVLLSDIEYNRYRFNPKRLSYDLYGTTELWFLILNANEAFSAIEFDTDTLYLYSPDILNKLGRILNIESEVLDYNEQELYDERMNQA